MSVASGGIGLVCDCASLVPPRETTRRPDARGHKVLPFSVSAPWLPRIRRRLDLSEDRPARRPARDRPYVVTLMPVAPRAFGSPEYPGRYGWPIHLEADVGHGVGEDLVTSREPPRRDGSAFGGAETRSASPPMEGGKRTVGSSTGGEPERSDVVRERTVARSARIMQLGMDQGSVESVVDGMGRRLT
jgi:hypothetical protein